MEGVMGLYDGLGGIRKEGSSYHLAEVTKTPVILVVNAHGMGRSILPVIRGFLDYDRHHLIRGVILNQTSVTFCETIRPEIERELSLPVLGCLPKLKELHWDSRHLGLVMPEEIADVKKQIQTVADTLGKTMDCGRLLAIAASAEELETDPLPKRKIADVRIGIARDAAFCFYYEDNLQLLREAGAELVPFSPLQDESLPEGIAGLILGGGYPELHAKALSKNTPMRKAVHDAVAGGLPTIAECGGFLYLHETLCDDEGVCYPMAGVISASAKNTGKLVRFGYVMLTEKEENFLPAGAQIAGHEFHYYDSTDNGAGAVAKKPVTGRSWECVHESPSQWMGFPHLYYYSNPEYAYRFLKKAADRIYLKK
jgi:cobyrinic acid a,c-diamide synthase